MRCQPRYDGPVYIWLKNKQSCLLCSEVSDDAMPICTACEIELPWLGDQCRQCALPMPMSGLSCAQCSIRPPAFCEVLAPWLYDFPVDSLILRFKHQSKWPSGRLLAQLLGQFLQHRFDEGLPRPDYLVPVPLARKRLRQRGFNQAGMLANWLGTFLSLPVNERLITRTKETPAQQGLNAKARKHNLRGAFTLLNAEQVRGCHVALIDDVLTTASTAEAISRLLIEAGAWRVDVYCLGRTAKPEE